jgi:hypothetical protein
MRFVFAACLSLMLVGCWQRRPAEVREFQAGFHGWAVIVWGISGYPPLPIEDGKIIERFPADGVIITSSQQQFGWAGDEAYFIDSSGKQLSLPPRIVVGHVGSIQQRSRRMNYSELFVGSEAELQASPKIGAPQIDKLFAQLCPDA